MDLFRDCLLYHCGFRDKNREKVLEFFGENAATNIAPEHHLPAISFLETRKTLVKKNLDKIYVEGDEINTVPLPNEQLELAYAKERGENSIFDYETLHLYRKNSYEDVTLKVSENGHIQYNELTSLQRHKYLTDAVINSCHTVFKEQFVSNKCRVLSTFFLTKLFEIERMKFDEIVELINLQQRWLYGKKDNVLFFENVEIILIPYNEYKHHWSLMYLDLVKGKVGMLDSSKYTLYSTLKENISNILSFFITMNKFNNHGIECLQIENWDTKENLDLYCEPVPQQLDGYNCGVFVVMNVYKILENDGKLISFIQAKDADLCRKLLFDQLIDRHFKFGGKDKEGHNILSNKKPKSNLSFDRKAGPSVSEITDNVVGKSNKRIDKEKVFESSVSDNADTKVAQMPLQGKEDQPIEKENVSNKPQDTEKEISNPFSDITDASVNTREGAQSKNRPTSPAGDLNDLEEAQLDSNDAQEKVSSVAATTTSSNSNTRGKVAPTSPPTTDTDDSGGGTGSSSEEEDSDNQSITNQAVATNTRKEKKRIPVLNISSIPINSNSGKRGKKLNENSEFERLKDFLFNVKELDNSENNLFHLPKLASEENKNEDEDSLNTESSEQSIRDEFKDEEGAFSLDHTVKYFIQQLQMKYIMKVPVNIELIRPSHKGSNVLRGGAIMKNTSRNNKKTLKKAPKKNDNLLDSRQLRNLRKKYFFVTT